MADAMWMKLRKVPWEKYKMSPSSKKQVPRILEALASRKGARAMKAGHDMWVALCSGQVWPAAEPAFPFLVDILGIAQPEVQGEVLDLFLKFATVPNDEDAEEWQKRLRMILSNEHRFMTKLSHSRDEIVAEKAEKLLAVI
ncbi:hypothetical protein NT6N_22830 [Oceaniferula spumae]|uniref:DUF5071 domain-containing protein n=1 Tax=Oceaniferula spumae TaxID=2979115 RepID=A0AAT9FMR4_9BACT